MDEGEYSMKERDLALDALKGFLVILMIFAHILQFFPLNGITAAYSQYVNLTTFSGFMFAFGYVSYITYISRDFENIIFVKKMIKNFIRIMCAYYISGLGFTFLIQGDIQLKVVLDILFLAKIPGYSEFLLSFAFLYFIIFLFKRKWFCLNVKQYIGIVFISFLMCFFPYDRINISLIGVFVGSTTFYCFPIIQYFSYFITGMFLAKNKMVFNKIIFAVSILGTCILGVYRLYFGILPKRFPPSLVWIIGGYGFIYCYYLCCKQNYFNNIKIWLGKIGQHTLSYLVISNISIFALVRLLQYFETDIHKVWLLFYVTIFALCIVLSCSSIFLMNLIKVKLCVNRDSEKTSYLSKVYEFILNTVNEKLI